MKKVLLFICLCLASNVSSEIVIRSTQSWSKSDYGYSWNSDAGLSYNSTVWGETYYNSSWQDLSKPTSIQTKKVYKWFYARPDYKRDWNFTIPITNLNAEQGYSYHSKSNPNLKQMSSQIYWAIQIGFKADGVDRDITIWLKRSDKRYYEYIEGEASDSEKYIQYSVGDGNWTTSTCDYPSCAQGSSPLLCISTYTYGSTSIWWARQELTSFNSYMDEIRYIQVYVGTQAKIQIGQASANAEGQNEYNQYFLQMGDDLIKSGQYAAAKQKLYNSDGWYYELNALKLAYCYLMLEEYDQAISMADALIKFNGEHILDAYYFRGIAHEEKSNYLNALEDYRLAGSVAADEYNRLYNAIYSVNKSAPSNNQQKKQQSTQQNKKPALTR